jgi:hypothetical protein
MIVNLCIVEGEAMDLDGELANDLKGDEVVDPVGVESCSLCCFFLNIFLSLKQLFAQGSLSCIIDISEKNISEETLPLILLYSS